MASLIGKTIKNQYKVIEFLGRGGMAEVYKVEDTKRGVYLAMKVLREDLAEDRVFLRRFQREAHNLAKLQHPNIVRFYGLEQDGRLAFILMDYIDGTTLRGEIFDANKPLPKERIIEILMPVCKALHYAHQTGIVHCDVKTSNIMIDKHGKVYLADFGIARMADAATSTMVGIGTPAYMAPELIRGENPTPQTDIYALGIVLYEMLTGGERPFIGESASTTGTTAEKVRWEHLKLAAPSPRTYNKAVSVRAEAAVLQCLEKKQGKRFTSAVALLGALGGDARQLEKKPSRRMKQKAQKKDFIQKRKIKPTQRQSADRREKKPIWQRWYLWAGLAAAAVVVLLTQITPPAVEIPTPKTDTLPATTLPMLGVGSTMVSEKDAMTMMHVPKGNFLWGSTESDQYAYHNEFPQRSIYLDAFWIDQTEVSNTQYQQCVVDGFCSLIYLTKYYNDSSYSNHPVVYVNWHDASDYCEWAGRRLPTEAEWEKAARGTDGRTYPWGEGISCSQVDYGDCNEFRETSPVGYFGDAGASPYGVLDMAGNVWEWVSDWYDSDYYGKSPADNPTGPNSGQLRVLRGGSWSKIGSDARSANRYKSYFPGSMPYSIGFRCALNAESP